MAAPSEKLADSLEMLRKLQEDGHIAIRSADLSRTHRERLVKNGFLEEALKGWYIPSRPDGPKGESTAWYASFWQFCATYLDHLKGDGWCLSPEQSISLHAENWTVPRQLLVRAVRARNNVTPLPHGTSLLDMRSSLPPTESMGEVNGIRIFALPAALVACGPKFFTQNPTDMRTALSLIGDASEVLKFLARRGTQHSCRPIGRCISQYWTRSNCGRHRSHHASCWIYRQGERSVCQGTTHQTRKA